MLLSYSLADDDVGQLDKQKDESYQSIEAAWHGEHDSDAESIGSDEDDPLR